MNPWPFVVGAYAVAILAIVALIISSWTAMRRAEADAEAIGP
jgi:heme exporter protein CcmD